MNLKKLNKIFVLCLLSLFATNVYAQTQSLNTQDSGFTFLYNIPGNFSSINVDALENIYAISDGSLIKFSPIDKSVQTYNNIKRYGTPSFLDVTNPFKPLLYFKNFSTIVVLDKYLSNKGTINLRKSGIFSVKAIGASYDNKIWIFDEQDFKLKKINDDGSVLMESTDLRVLIGESPLPERIFDNEGFVYLYDTSAGFYIFDYYGTYKNKLPLTGWESFLISNGFFYGLEKDKIFSYEIKTKVFKEYLLPESFKNSTSIATINGKIFVLKEYGIDVMQINKN